MQTVRKGVTQNEDDFLMKMMMPLIGNHSFIYNNMISGYFF